MYFYVSICFTEYPFFYLWLFVPLLIVENRNTGVVTEYLQEIFIEEILGKFRSCVNTNCSSKVIIQTFVRKDYKLLFLSVYTFTNKRKSTKT